MTTDEQPVLMGREALDVARHREPERIVALLREANDHWARQTSDSDRDGGLVWDFRVGPDEKGAPVLRVGVRGDRGAVEWFHGEEDLIPAEGGLNADWVDYWSWFGYDSSAPPWSEIPIDKVYEVVAEFVRTTKRPTCIPWCVPEE